MVVIQCYSIARDELSYLLIRAPLFFSSCSRPELYRYWEVPTLGLDGVELAFVSGWQDDN